MYIVPECKIRKAENYTQDQKRVLKISELHWQNMIFTVQNLRIKKKPSKCETHTCRTAQNHFLNCSKCAELPTILLPALYIMGNEIYSKIPVLKCTRAREIASGKQTNK